MSPGNFFPTRSQRFSYLILFLLALFSFEACKHDSDPVPFVDDGCYPPEIAAIIVNKCAVTGCHNTASKDAASGLDLSSWDNMLLGNSSGAVVIPYRSDQSTLFYFINTDSTLGITQLPTMPYNRGVLSPAEVLTIRNWIDSGAPNCQAYVNFTGDPNQKKFYVANQGCDLVSVHNPDTKLIMSLIDVGNSPAIESPHQVKLSPDGQFWYVVFINGTALQKYRTSDDQFVAEANITSGSWNTFAISPDGTKAWAVDFSGVGRIAYVNLITMQMELMYQDPGGFTSPHGSMTSPDGNTLYVTGQLGNKIYKWDVTDPLDPEYEDVIINNSGLPADPHEVGFSPDGTKYFVTCQGRDEVRVFDATNDAFITAIPTGDFPLEMSFSVTNSYLFVTCEIGNAVTVIDYNTLTAIKTIQVGLQPHGLAVDDAANQVYVANRNTPSAQGGGIPPHHTSSCGGQNGYLTIIDMSTLELVPGFRMELSVDPYSVAVRK